MTLTKRIAACKAGDALPLLMGIVNITPDSFSDGGRFFTPDAALQQARLLREEGADVLDLGAESTRPGYSPVDAEEEWARLAPVIRPLAEEGACISVDTTKASVARSALQAGAQMVNDVWGLQADPAMADCVAEAGAIVAIMHNRHEVTPDLDFWDEWRRFFDISLKLAERAAIAKESILLDPGVGFGKTLEQNIWAVQNMRRLGEYYDLPVLLGLSRKSMFGGVLGRKVEDRLAATLAANLYGMREGASMLRVHDIQPHKDAMMIEVILSQQTALKHGA